jgi:hypothetical protein
LKINLSVFVIFFVSHSSLLTRWIPCVNEERVSLGKEDAIPRKMEIRILDSSFFKRTCDQHLLYRQESRSIHLGTHLGMDSSNRSAGKTMQHLVTGFRCEKRGCHEEAQWFVSFDTHAYHWCGKHIVLQMEDKRFWQLKVAPEMVRSK